MKLQKLKLKGDRYDRELEGKKCLYLPIGRASHSIMIYALLSLLCFGRLACIFFAQNNDYKVEDIKINHQLLPLAC